jgi:DNA-binding response OmpR family regulator
MKRRILLVDDEVAVLLTLKAVLEISGFDVDTAASAREGVSKLHTREYQMLITDMRMEHDVAGVEVIRAARAANYHPVVALLTAYPVADEDWQEMGADQLLVKPMHTRMLLQQIEDMIASHERKSAEQVIAANLPDRERRVPPKKATKATLTKVAQKKKALPAKGATNRRKPAKTVKKTGAGKTAVRSAKTKSDPKSSAKTASKSSGKRRY